MSHHDLKALLEQAGSPPAGEASRQRIKQAAMEAYREAGAADAENISHQRQGSGNSSRLTDESNISQLTKRNPQMKTNYSRTRHWMSGLAASFALVIGLLTVQQYSGKPGPQPAVNTTPHAQQVAKLDLDSQPTEAIKTEARFKENTAASTLPSTQATIQHRREGIGLSDSRPSLADDAMAEAEAMPAQRAPQAQTSVGLSALEVQLPPPAQAAARSGRADKMSSLGAAAIAPTNPAPVASDALISPGPRSERDRFEHVDDNPVKQVREAPVSTFSIDVDTASYSFVRRQLNAGRMPASNAVRSEEMINYFDYDYPPSQDREAPFATHISVIDSPWREGNQLVHIGLKGFDIATDERPGSNLVLLLDVSGSMNSPDKLPLLKQSMGLLLDSLKPTDTVAIVVYAGAAGAVLEPTPVAEKAKILAALEQLRAGGSTAGGQGLALAYRLAELNFDPERVNRIILATDGDFNVGVTGDEQLEDFVARKRASGIYLSVLGFGQGNYQDALMQRLAQNGNGVAAYIDTLSEAQKVLSHEATASLFTIAGDVKIQVEFNPATVAEYRLIGYETRMLQREDFANDKVDAGEIGSGHTVTAIYEITPVGSDAGLIGTSRYQTPPAATVAHADELGFLRLRYKLPGAQKSRLIEAPIIAPAREGASIPTDTLQREVDFSVAVAGFAQLLKGGQYTGDWNYDDAIELALRSRGSDEYGYRTEFVQLVRKAKIASAM